MSHKGEALFAVWAPPESRWAVWAKPILFAHAPANPSGSPPLDLPSAGGLARRRDAAVVVDISGVAGVNMGLALAEGGYRPVPLYNSSVASGSLINMSVIANALAACAPRLQRIALPADAPPAFLLNADRMDHSSRALMPGVFDNRWRVVPQDMPSAKFLQAAGIREVVLISDKLRDDLAHVFYRYSEAGLDIRRTADAARSPDPMPITRPNNFKSMFYRMGVYAGLRRNSAGGFGAITPDPGQGGGG